MAGDRIGRRGAISGRAELVLYAVAAVVYIAVGFREKAVFAWWPYSTAYFMTFMWLVPTILRRVRARTDRKAGPGGRSA